MAFSSVESNLSQAFRSQTLHRDSLAMHCLPEVKNRLRLAQADMYKGVCRSSTLA